MEHDTGTVSGQAGPVAVSPGAGGHEAAGPWEPDGELGSLQVTKWRAVISL